MIEHWLYGVVAVLSLAHLAVLVYAYRQGNESFLAGEADPRADGEEQDSRVSCPDCGTTNERGYRYCRDCVSELPGHLSFDVDSTAPQGRRLP
ncbi:MAG: hypothetical protein ABEH56_01410 [Salinirussus sp.]